MILHTVKSGETAYSIARRYGVSPERLIYDNGISAVANALPIGLSLVVLVPNRTHTVAAGDTLEDIARRFGTTVNALYRNNLPLGGREDIAAGQVLVIDYADPPIFDFSVGGYAYPFISRALLDETLPAMKKCMPFTYGFTEEGTLVPIDDAEMLARCFVYETNPFLHLSTLTESGTFSNELSDVLLSTPSLWQTLTDNILTTLREKGYRGLDIDFEYVLRRNREAYPRFLTYVRERLSPEGYPLIVALPPKVSSTQEGLLYEGADYEAVGKAADYVLLMTYEWGYTYGPPMPVSPLPSVRRVLNYAVSEIAPEKIYMAISNYGYDWTLPYVSGESRARSLSTVEAVSLASENNVPISYSVEYEAPYFFYTDSHGAEHEVWFEDARSLYRKLALIRDYGFHGGLYWNLNRENPQNLAVLAGVMRYDGTDA